MMVYDCPMVGTSGWGMMGYGWLFQLIIFAVFFLVVWWLLKSNNFRKDEGTPSEILKKRLAKGEITKKQYEELKKEIE